jgi:uncharacterized protein (UPF0264 family)
MMGKFASCRNPPGLLVSVRNEVEALAALAGGADVIDVKEPARGPLGAADPQTIARIVQVVANRAPTTAAAGELLDFCKGDAGQPFQSLPPGVTLCKIGLRGCCDLANWQDRWKRAVAAICGHCESASRPVAVAYADWQAARAPKPDDVLHAAVHIGCPALLVDTWEKSGGNLFDWWTGDEVGNFVQRVRAQRIMIVLAGSLNGPSLAAAARLAPDLVAVRGAACAGGRGGTVTVANVEAAYRLVTEGKRMTAS